MAYFKAKYFGSKYFAQKSFGGVAQLLNNIYIRVFRRRRRS